MMSPLFDMRPKDVVLASAKGSERSGAHISNRSNAQKLDGFIK